MIELYADGADEREIYYYNSLKNIKGLTTNPSLMKKSGVKDYTNFAKKILKRINKPISFEVFSDHFDEMYEQAKTISSWGENVFVKIPVCNSKGQSSYKLIKELSEIGIQLNITAVFTKPQVDSVIKSLNNKTKSIISIFAGRIADTGIDPEPIIKRAVKIASQKKNIKILWASCREVFNIEQAKRSGCHIITVPPSILKKLKLKRFSLEKYSILTVKEFNRDAKIAGYKI